MNEPIYLRALEMSDLERCHAWHNDGSLFEMLGGTFRFVSTQAETAWLDRKTSYAASSDEVNLAMCDKETDKHVGNIYLRHINWVSRHAELSIFIGDREERSKGYGQSAVRQLLAHAFGDLGLRKVYLTVLSDNGAAIHIYKKCGFTIEGTLKNHEFKQGQWKSLTVMAVCVDEQHCQDDSVRV